MKSIFLGVYSHTAAVTSFGISIRTGPGLPERAILNASLNVFAKSLISLTGFTESLLKVYFDKYSICFS